MAATVEALSTVKKKVTIDISDDEIQESLNAAYTELRKTAKIKGFRPGKATRQVLERYYKKDVHANILSDLMQKTFVSAITQHDLAIVGDPIFDTPKFEGKGPYQYTATVEIRPELATIDFKGLSLTKNIYKCGDAEIESQLNMLQKKVAEKKQIEEVRPVREGDFVLIDFEGFLDGKPFEKTPKTENYLLEVGASHITEAFDAEIVGMSSGETKNFQITFPGDFVKELAELTIDFEVTLKEIREEVLPELDDDFVKNFGPYETLADMKNEIYKSVQNGYDKRSEQELNEAIFQSLIERTDFELPEIMVQYELETIIAELERSYAANNMKLEDIGMTRDMLAERYKELAEKQVRRLLILNKIIEQEALELTDREIDKGFHDIAEYQHGKVEDIRSYYEKNPRQLEVFKLSLLEKKAINLIIENSEIEEKQVSASEETEGSENVA